MEHIEFHKGEQRYIDFDVRSTKNETFSIVDANYIVTKKDGTVFDQGSATVTNGNTVRYLFNASEEGVYIAKLRVTIPPELIKHKAVFVVK